MGLVVRGLLFGCRGAVLIGKSSLSGRGVRIELMLMCGRVNMYASTWICTKEGGIEGDEVKAHSRKTSLAELRLGGPALRME